MTAPPGTTRNSASAQTRRPSTRGGGSLRRDVLFQCGGCGAKVTARVNGSRLVFQAMAGVATLADLARERWLQASTASKHHQADRLRREFWDVENDPTRYIHRACGGELSAFDFHGRTA